MLTVHKTRLETKVGIFIFVGLLLLATLMVQFSKSTSLFRGTYTLRLHAVNVGGLKEKSGVLLAGVQVGSVSEIHLAQKGKSVLIVLRIYKDYPIYHDARFVIEQSGFLGDQYVSAIPTLNEDPVLTNDADIYCDPPFDLQEVARSASGFIQHIDETAKKLDASVTDLRQTVLNATTLGNFGVAITNMRAFTEQALDAVSQINHLVATNGSQISVAVSNFVFFSGDLTNLVDYAHEILETNNENIFAATKNLNDLTVTFKQVADDVQAGKGLAGTVLENQELATNFQDIAANLSVTTSNLNRLGLWGILWSHKPSATNKLNSTHSTSTRP
jgi:phospholipid/cholesterol/gamma-HCH transport system substrate-binding protein